MKIAVEGCAHGELEKIYECIETLQAREGIKVDLLICCGDFQAVRNGSDLQAMAVSDKYKKMCSFYKYYSGERRAPILTIFIGGNHEASNYLQELPYGGWVAPNIYYLGRAGVIQIGNLRIGGLSGIFKPHHYLQGLWECPPYDANSLRSVYHIRALDVFRLSQLKEKVHVMLSHDWPQGITEYGDVDRLLERKPFFREDIESGKLGSAPAKQLLKELKPDYWFAAHLHCQFAGIVKHEDGETKFLALDKCLPRRRHLQILDLPPEFDGDMTLKYDAEWLAILKCTNHLLTVKNVDCHMPGPGGDERYIFTPTEEEKSAVLKLMGDMKIKDNFTRTAPIYQAKMPKCPPVDAFINAQTTTLCEKLGIDDPLHVVLARSGRTMKKPQEDSPLVMQELSLTSPTPEAEEKILMPPVSFTPMKTKLSLPAPITPSENDTDISDRESILSPETKSLLSESACSSTVECPTPMSAGPKKTFKRRNLAMYTLGADDSVSTSSSILDSDSPKTSKLPRDITN